jgi:hypothetical protein
MSELFTVENEINIQYRHFNAEGTQLTLRLAAPPEEDGTDPATHFLNSMIEHFKYALRNSNDSDMVGITIHNEVNQNDKPIGIIFRRKDQLSGDVVCSVLEKVTQSNARFNALDMLVVVHSVRMPVGFGRVTTKGRQIFLMAHLKRSITEVRLLKIVSHMHLL